jgi:hypothetical protein
MVDWNYKAFWNIMILLANLQKKEKNSINNPIKILTTKTLKSWNNNEFEKTALFWLECLIFWVEFQFQHKSYSIHVYTS